MVVESLHQKTPNFHRRKEKLNYAGVHSEMAIFKSSSQTSRTEFAYGGRR